MSAKQCGLNERYQKAHAIHINAWTIQLIIIGPACISSFEQNPLNRVRNVLLITGRVQNVRSQATNVQSWLVFSAINHADSMRDWAVSPII